MELRRRGFLKGMGALSGIAASGVSFEAVAQAAKAAQPTKGAAATAPFEVKHVKSGCAICPNFCGIDATVVNGVVRTIYPDTARAEFYNHGICPKAHPGCTTRTIPIVSRSRSSAPIRKRAADEDPKWVEISWEEAFGDHRRTPEGDQGRQSVASWSGSTDRANTSSRNSSARRSPRRSARRTWCTGRPRAKPLATLPTS